MRILLKPWFSVALRVLLWASVLCLLLSGGLLIWVNSYAQAPQLNWTPEYNELNEFWLTEDPLFVGVPWARKLSAPELRLVTPKGKADWMRYKDGFAVFDDEQTLRFVTFRVTTQTPGVDIRISVGPWPYYAGNTQIYTLDYKTSDLGDASYILCRDPYSITASTQVAGIYYTFTVDRILEQEAAVKADFETVLECFSTYEPGVPSLKWISPVGEPEYFAYWDYTVQQARNDDTFGKYFPKEDPVGLSEFSGKRLNCYLMRNQMNGRWRGEMGEVLNWDFIHEKEYIPTPNGMEERVYTPGDTPFLEGMSLTKEMLNTLLTDDGAKQVLRADIRYGNVIVTVRWESATQGVDVDWLYRQLKAVLWQR